MSTVSVKMELVSVQVNTLITIDFGGVGFEDSDRVVFEIFFIADADARPLSLQRIVKKWSVLKSASQTFTPALPGQYIVALGKTSGALNYRSKPFVATA